MVVIGRFTVLLISFFSGLTERVRVCFFSFKLFLTKKSLSTCKINRFYLKIKFLVCKTFDRDRLSLKFRRNLRRLESLVINGSLMAKKEELNNMINNWLSTILHIVIGKGLSAGAFKPLFDEDRLIFCPHLKNFRLFLNASNFSRFAI